MNWSLFLLNHLLNNALGAQSRHPFSYSWLLILISLVAWMEPKDYQPMTIEAVKVFHGAHYQKLWWVEEPSRQKYCVIHFWIYWEALQVAIVAFPWISPYTMAKYQRIIWFFVGPHSIHIQARWDPNK